MNSMDSGKTPFEHTPETATAGVLQQFIGVFASRGWLNQTVRIKYRGRSYSISCSNTGFMAYRINDNWGTSHGFSGWPVCIVDSDHVVEHSPAASLAPDEPSASDWLSCIANEDFQAV